MICGYKKTGHRMHSIENGPNYGGAKRSINQEKYVIIYKEAVEHLPQEKPHVSK